MYNKKCIRKLNLHSNPGKNKKNIYKNGKYIIIKKNKKGICMANKPCLPFTALERVLTILDKISIFGGLNQTQLSEVLRSLEVVNYKKNEFIFHQGDMPSFIYIVSTGKVKLFIEAGHIPLEFIELGTGKSFGEIALVGIQPHTASAIATEDTELLILSNKALLNFLKTDKDLFSLIVLNIAREACRRLGQTENILSHYFKQ